jgi:hypothetical protein
MAHDSHRLMNPIISAEIVTGVLENPSHTYNITLAKNINIGSRR